jgi:outer membrane protein TolC
LLDLADETISNYLKTLQAVEDQVEGGIATVVEVNLARANLASSRAERHWAERQQAQDLRALDVLLGRHPSGKQAAPRTLPQVSLVPAGLPSELLLRRPDLRAAQVRLAAARLRREAADKLNLPSLILSGNAGATSTQLSNLLNSRNLLWSMAAGLSQPIFAGGAIPAQKQQARAQQEEAAADWAQAVLEAFQEVETALTREVFINREITALEAASTAAAAAEQKTQRLYEEGLSNLTNLLVAQRRALDIRRNLIQTRRARIENRLSLYLALGGGFQ